MNTNYSLLMLPKFVEYRFALTFMSDKFDFLTIKNEQQKIRIHEKVLTVGQIFDFQLYYMLLNECKIELNLSNMRSVKSYDDYGCFDPDFNLHIIQKQDENDEQKIIIRKELQVSILVDMISQFHGIEYLVKSQQENISFGLLQFKFDLGRECAILSKELLCYQDIINKPNINVIQIFHNLNQHILVHSFSDLEASAVEDLVDPIFLFLIFKNNVIKIEVNSQLLISCLEAIQPVQAINEFMSLWVKDDWYEKRRRINSVLIKKAYSKIQLNYTNIHLKAQAAKYNILPEPVYTEVNYKQQRLLQLLFLNDKLINLQKDSITKHDLQENIESLSTQIENTTQNVKNLDRNIQKTEDKRNQLRDKKQLYKKLKQTNMSNFDPRKEDYQEACRQDFIDMEKRRILRKQAHDHEIQIQQKEKQEKQLKMFKDRLTSIQDNEKQKNLQIQQRLDTVQQQKRSQSLQQSTVKINDQNDQVTQIQPSVLQDLKINVSTPARPQPQTQSSRRISLTQTYQQSSSNYLIVQNLIEEERQQLKFKEQVLKRKKIDQKQKEQLKQINKQTKEELTEQRQQEKQQKLIAYTKQQNLKKEEEIGENKRQEQVKLDTQQRLGSKQVQ
eukprot:EST42664.1 Hypothetical protein SS50377_17678 [Spironucleus salmonicida]